MSRETATALAWLPIDPGWQTRLSLFAQIGDPGARWAEAVALAGCRIDMIQTNRLARAAQQTLGGAVGIPPTVRRVRLAVLATSTVSHLLPGLFVAGLRRGLWLETFVTDYNQYVQALLDPGSALATFAPTEVLLCFDARFITSALDTLADGDAVAALRAEKLAHLRQVWALCRDRLGCPVTQQAVLPLFDAVLGANEHRLPGSPACFVHALNDDIRHAADEDNVVVLALDERCTRHGLAAWYEPMLWFKAKQEVAPTASPLYGELALRLVDARQGRSRKALVLDLDDTLWGGVIGDDGLNGIVVGQGSATGESFLALQTYAKTLARRGIILAVCSKNDEANALLPFDSHPDMALRRSDISAFVANWDDKATNIRRIATELNIGLDSLVFVDDNPFERELVRTELPMVAVPEVPDEPALVVGCLADAGYFESVGLTTDDRRRTELYRTNASRAALAADTTDIDGYLGSLDMRLVWRRFDRDGLARIVQLINKTNQFNLTTRRYTESEVAALVDASDALGLQFRLIDRFGDNGMIAVVIGRCRETALEIETWLMSCRVLGRDVERATLSVLAGEAAAIGLRSLVGSYRPTAKNGMVREHYERLGFTRRSCEGEQSTWTLDLQTFTPADVQMAIVSGESRA